MASVKPPVFQTAVSAWADAFGAIGAMPGAAGVALAILLVNGLVGFATFPDPTNLAGNPWLLLYAIGASLVDAALLAPLAIAVHRYVLLGEAAKRYPFEPASRRYQRFVVFALVVNFVWYIPDLIKTLSSGVAKENSIYATLVGAMVFIVQITLTILVLRRAILFPGIAVDAPGATWGKAGRDTKGSSWRVAFIFLLTALPLMVIGAALYLPLVGAQGQLSAATRLFISLISAVINIPTLCAFAAAASHIYRARADAMTRPELSGSAEFQAG